MQTYYLSQNPTDRNRSPIIRDPWRPLILLNSFRTLLASLFCILVLSHHLIHPLGSSYPLLFLQASLVYLLLSMIFWVMHRHRQPGYAIQVYISAISDIFVLTLLMHASGGIQSGLGVLLVLTIAISSITLGSRSALGIAALATIVILSEQVVATLFHPHTNSYPAAGLLGITYFATAVTFQFLARRVRESEELAQIRGIDLANLAQLTEHIIQRMQTGVLVIDQSGNTRLINESAAQMLGIRDTYADINIRQAVPELAEQWQAWLTEPDHEAEKIQLTRNSIDISPRFASIGNNAAGGTLIFLQDMAAMAQQAQQLQLASLGRLTASIAHEIRNPLGAISHAGQLLAESEQLDANDARLSKIIVDHSARLNTIVENIMSVSRRKPSQVELFNLKHYLERFVSDFATGMGVPKEAFRIDIEPEQTDVRFDTGHLHQILTNLCDNGLRHSRLAEDPVKIILRGGLEPGSSRPHLDVFDAGPGVSEEASEHLFEPFFTTETRGTGLGLYLSRQLAEGNQAHLNYLYQDDGRGFFRLTFQDPRRHIEST
ncbi:MAG: ATP-binding protein [Gammaproteobacteria bacterium]|jgi:two-component system, NtrC family, sensor histidine kinase PilS